MDGKGRAGVACSCLDGCLFLILLTPITETRKPFEIYYSSHGTTIVEYKVHTVNIILVNQGCSILAYLCVSTEYINVKYNITAVGTVSWPVNLVILIARSLIRFLIMHYFVLYYFHYCHM